MRVSQRLDCALRALVELAREPAGGRIAAGAVAERLRLPRRFCEQQLTELARAGLVECRRGGGGGCALARGAGEITLADVVTAVEGTVLDVPRAAGSAAAEAWQAVAGRLAASLASLTIAEIAARQNDLDAESLSAQRASSMYYI